MTGALSQLCRPRYNLLAITANNAATITFSQWLDVMSRTVGILWLILLPMTFGFLWMWFHHPAQPRFTRRPLNIHTLPHIFSALSPAIAPFWLMETTTDSSTDKNVPSAVSH